MKLKFALAIALLTYIACHISWRDGVHLEYNFDHYKTEFNKNYPTEVEHKIRELIFNENLKKIKEINDDPNSTWRAGVNHLTDRIPSELERMRGYNRDLAFHQRRFSSLFSPSRDFLQNLPKSVDWRNYTSPVKNQGHCGSCWTFATTATLEAHMKIQNKGEMVLSEQQLVDCVENVHKCGGTGGCHGATAELAYEYVKKNGLALSKNYEYKGQQNACQDKTVEKAIVIEDFVKLPENDYNSLMIALATTGPVAVSVAAEGWHFYESGIFNGNCGYIINHAVVAVGYGTDEKGNDYWIVRNSWSETWGEKGHIRIPREKSADVVECGLDTDTSEGSVCEGGPKQVTVCGKCGILSDSSYPVAGSIIKHMHEN